jgi:hypothetical protein
MKKLYKILFISLILGLTYGQSYAGNKDRAGEAGAGQLLINPWARSNGLGGANSASLTGLEAQFWNVGGLAHTKGSEIIFSNTTWLKGTGTNIAAFGISQKLGENGGVLGLSVVSFSYGEMEITTVAQPDGGIGTFSPSQSNVNLSYAKTFSNSIYGGINIKFISESTSDTHASTLAIDAGIQYVTGKHDEIKFGVALKNVGGNMSYEGDGLSFRGFVPGQVNALTVEQRSAGFELPSLIRIGFSYDIFLGDKSTLTPSYTFTSNSFTNDQHSTGIEFKWSKFLVLRAGYVFENGMFGDEVRMNALTGFAAGASIRVPFNKDNKSGFSIDYAYQDSNPFAGSHSIGIRLFF